MAEERHQYSAGYAASHGRFALIPASYVFLFDGSPGEADERVLLQRRANTGYYDGWWAASAAGHVDPGESVFTCATREAAEELGVELSESALQPLTAMHRTMPGGGPIEQRIDVFFACRSWNGEPSLLEHKADALEWFALDALPDELVHHERFVLEGHRDGTLLPVIAFGF
jgi:8-oxo-dGTP diphosphatase